MEKINGNHAVSGTASPATKAIDAFIARVDSIYEIEYGDFKRKIGQYILRLQSSLRAGGMKPDDQKIIQEMLLKIVYNPRPDIESARMIAHDLAMKLRPKHH